MNKWRNDKEFQAWRKSKGMELVIEIEAAWEAWQACKATSTLAPEDDYVGMLEETNAALTAEIGQCAQLIQKNADTAINNMLATSKCIKALNDENAALKAEVARLRQSMDAPSFFLLGISGSTNVPEVFRQAAQRHHESLDAAMKETR